LLFAGLILGLTPLSRIILRISSLLSAALMPPGAGVTPSSSSARDDEFISHDDILRQTGLLLVQPATQAPGPGPSGLSSRGSLDSALIHHQEGGFAGMDTMETEETLHEISCEIGVIRYESSCPRRQNPAWDDMEMWIWEVGGARWRNLRRWAFHASD
jgi:hypothetical protein